MPTTLRARQRLITFPPLPPALTPWKGEDASRRARLDITPTRAQGQRGEKHQQHLVDEIAAVKNHRRRHGEKEGGPSCRALTEAVFDQEQQENQSNAERDGDDTELRVTQSWRGEATDERLGMARGEARPTIRRECGT